MKKNYFIIIQLIISSLSFGQIKDLDIPTTTAGPDSYQFNKISSVFNNNSGGGFSYSYPLGQISEGNMTIPISLNYYTNGIKVDELAGYTGTNWNLSYGGVITRTVKGIPDEQASERWHPHIFDYTSDDFYNKITSIARGPAGKQYDSERDLFQFNINDKSGYFYLPSGTTKKNVIINDIISKET